MRVRFGRYDVLFGRQGAVGIGVTDSQLPVLLS